MVLPSCLLGIQPTKLHGTDYVPLAAIAAELGMERSWIEAEKEVRLQSQWTRMDFRLHKRFFELNGLPVYVGDPITFWRGDLYIAEKDYEQSLKPILLPQAFPDRPKLFRIVLDPGHGGHDSGAVNPSLKLREEALALDLALRIKPKLEALGYQVLMTRSTDTFVKLSDRPAFANKNNADLFISIHFNAGPASVRGIETYAITNPWQPSTGRDSLHSSDKRTYSGNKLGPRGALFGYYVQRAMTEKTGAPDRGLKRARFDVLRNLEAPGVLIEGGFLSNATEGRNVGSSAYREKLAEAVVDAVLTYQRTLNRIRGR